MFVRFDRANAAVHSLITRTRPVDTLSSRNTPRGLVRPSVAWGALQAAGA